MEALRISSIFIKQFSAKNAVDESNFFANKTKKKIEQKKPSTFSSFSSLNNVETQPLAPGVTQKDVNMYKMVREKAAQSVAEIMNPGGRLNLATPSTTGINPNLTSPSSIAMAAQERCPAAIEFGPWDIDTWYSSPFPQEYAR